MERQIRIKKAKLTAIISEENAPKKGKFWSMLVTVIPWVFTIITISISTFSYQETEMWKHNDMLISTFKDFDNRFSVRFFNKVLDYEKTKIPLKEGGDAVWVSQESVAFDLRTNNLNFKDDEEVIVRDLADDYLNQLTQLYFNIQAKTITYEDVESRLSYYLDILTEDSSVIIDRKLGIPPRIRFINSFKNFIHTYKYTGVEGLIMHYKNKKNKDLACNCLIYNDK